MTLKSGPEAFRLTPTRRLDVKRSYNVIFA